MPVGLIASAIHMNEHKLDLIIAALQRIERTLGTMASMLADEMDEDQIELSLDGETCSRTRDAGNPL
jgi:hypothetical protein